MTTLILRETNILYEESKVEIVKGADVLNSVFNSCQKRQLMTLKLKIELSSNSELIEKPCTGPL